MRLSRVLATASAFALMTVAGYAADLPVRTAPPPVTTFVPAFTWTGFYVGLNAGVGWTNSGTVTVDDPILGPGVISTGSKTGFVGGAQAGYNWQAGAFVFGGEADIQYADLGNSIEWGDYSRFGISGNSNGQYLGTVRVRAGYAVDRALFYLTGGLAYGGLNSTALHGSTSTAGYTLGAGVEYAFTNNWTAKVEALYVNLDSGTKSLTLTDNNRDYTFYAKSGNGGGLVRLGVNYKF
jgi:outer membrane immunogenic protein